MQFIASLPRVATQDLQRLSTNTQVQLVPLRGRSILKINGSDALRFLQGQCTCDFTQLDKRLHLRGAHCNIKGRMHSNFVAAPLAEGVETIGLRLHQSITEHALRQLQKYALFSKVNLSLDMEHVCAGMLIPEEQTPTIDDWPSVGEYRVINDGKDALVVHVENFKIIDAETGLEER